jgi:hypothetical protein
MKMRQVNHLNTEYSGGECLSKISQDMPEGHCFTSRSKTLQEKPLEVQFNLQYVFRYMSQPKESWFSYVKF